MDFEDIEAPPDRETEKRQPTPEQMLMRQAVKYLTPKQKRVWELHNYDRYTQEEIALKMRISQQTVAGHLKACEVRITKWVKSNLGTYKLLKQEFGEEA